MILSGNYHAKNITMSASNLTHRHTHRRSSRCLSLEQQLMICCYFHPIPPHNSLLQFTSNVTISLRHHHSMSLSTTHRSDSSIAAAGASDLTPARDRVVDFGKYRGKMLGTLPSSYLRWVSKNLRARDFEEWSKLADEVLEDPVYGDRIEWEFAEEVLNGNRVATSSLRAKTAETAVSELLEIGQRFGWDNQDKVGWSRVNFELLGTSKGGRIPRTSRTQVPLSPTPTDCRDSDTESVIETKRAGLDANTGGHQYHHQGLPASSLENKRRVQRMERLGLKRSDGRHNKYGRGGGTSRSRTQQLVTTGDQKAKKELLGNGRRNAYANMSGRGEAASSSSSSSESGDDSGSESSKKDTAVKGEVYNPFPGRAGLLKKVLHLKRRRSL